MELLNKFLNAISGYVYRWRTRAGGIGVAAVLAATTWEVQQQLKLPLSVAGFVIPGVLVAWLVVWSLASGRIPIPVAGKKIVFSFEIDIEAERNFARIFNELRFAVAGLDLSERVLVKRIGSDIVRNDREAERYLDFGVAQIIWGRARAGKADSQLVQKFSVHWMQRFAGEQLNIDAILTDLKLLETGRRWTIAEVNDLVDVEIVAEDFLEMSLAVLGIHFLLESKLNDAAIIFRRVVSGLEQHGQKSLPRQRNLARFRDILNATELSLAYNAHEVGDHKRAVSILERVLPSFPRDVEYRLTLARAYYLSGNLEKARRCTDAIAALDQSHPAVYANRAFFAILDKKYKRAAEMYAKLARSSRDKLQILTSVSEFLEHQFDDDPDEYAYLYGLAVVNGLIDPQVEHDDLQRFLEVTANRFEYSALRDSANAILARRR